VHQYILVYPTFTSERCSYTALAMCCDSYFLLPIMMICQSDAPYHLFRRLV